MEIERKYLIDEKNLPADLESCRSVLIEQGYLCRKPVVRIRRMCEYCGCRVKKLVRVRVMNIELGNLPKGQYRDVTEAEMQELYRQLRAGNKKAGKSRRGTWTKNARE